MFRLGHARAAHWRDAVDACLGQLAPVPAAATLGFVYLADALAPHAGEILARLEADTGIGDWVGSVGVGVLATGTEYLDESALVVLLADFPVGEFQVFSGRRRPPAAGTRTASGASAAHFAVVHGDPHTESIPQLVEDMAGKVESGFLIGGLASARGKTIQIANGVLSGGLSGVVLSSRVPVVTRLTQGCQPLVPARGRAVAHHRITEAERNVIVTLDHRPALDVLLEDLGAPFARDLARAAHQIFAGLPIEGSDTGDYVVRNLVGIDPKNRLVAIGAEVEADMPLMFCRRDSEAARADLERMLAELSAELVGTPKGALYYSCLGRGEHMFGERSAELEIVRRRLGDLPLAGFFANGEISHDRLYGYTGVLAVFT